MCVEDGGYDHEQELGGCADDGGGAVDDVDGRATGELFAGGSGPEADVGAEGLEVVGDDSGLDVGGLGGEEAEGLVVGRVHGCGGWTVVRNLVSIVFVRDW